MSAGESYEYPNCEEDDCYCKRHWPNRSGGEEYKVVNNSKNGEYKIICEVGINNHTFIQGKCYLCNKWMIGSGLDIEISKKEQYKVCVRCCYVTYTDDFYDYFYNRFLKHGSVCEFHRLFNFSMDRVNDKSLVEDVIDCGLCGKTHPSTIEEGKVNFDDLFFFDCSGDYHFFDGDRECLVEISNLFEEDPNRYIELRNVLVKGFFPYKKEMLKKKSKDKKRKKENAEELAHQVFAKYLPNLNSKDDGYVCERLLCRGSSLLDIKQCKSLLKNDDVSAFVYWLTENKQE